MYNRQLDTFLATATAGSFNKAAEDLYISPPAVIKQINLLEEKLGVRLFVRTHRGLQLTPAGESLQRDARYIVAYCRDAALRAQQAAAQRELLRLGVSNLTPVQTLSYLLPELPGEIQLRLVPFENTPENAREILKHMGREIDVVAGIFDAAMLHYRECAATELLRLPLCCGVSARHRLAGRERLRLEDLYGETVRLIRRGWSDCMDSLRDALEQHPEIKIVDFSFYDLDVFNQCENSDDIIVAVEYWRLVHPLLRIIPVDWDFTIPFGIWHSHQPTPLVQCFLELATSLAARARV